MLPAVNTRVKTSRVRGHAAGRWLEVRPVRRAPEEPDVDERVQNQFQISRLKVPQHGCLLQRDPQIGDFLELATDQ